MHALAYVGQQRMRQSVQGQLRHLMCALPKLLVVAVPVCAVCVSVCRHTFREEERKIGRERGIERDTLHTHAHARARAHTHTHTQTDRRAHTKVCEVR